MLASIASALGERRRVCAALEFEVDAVSDSDSARARDIAEYWLDTPWTRARAARVMAARVERAERARATCVGRAGVAAAGTVKCHEEGCIHTITGVYPPMCTAAETEADAEAEAAIAAAAPPRPILSVATATLRLQEADAEYNAIDRRSYIERHAALIRRIKRADDKTEAEAEADRQR
jgi:hypothetical protein